MLACAIPTDLVHCFLSNDKAPAEWNGLKWTVYKNTGSDLSKDFFTTGSCAKLEVYRFDGNRKDTYGNRFGTRVEGSDSTASYKLQRKKRNTYSSFLGEKYV